MSAMNNPITPAMVVSLRGELTQTAAARLWRCSLRTVQRWEAGEIRPSYAAWVGMQALKSNHQRYASTVGRKPAKGPDSVM